LKRRKTLIINTTIFDERAYNAGLRDAMTKRGDEFCLLYPGIQQVQHEYFYAVHGANAASLEKYLGRAYALAKDFGG
jgi:NAD(P)H dehydrogenase (quinone)